MFQTITDSRWCCQRRNRGSSEGRVDLGIIQTKTKQEPKKKNENEKIVCQQRSIQIKKNGINLPPPTPQGI